MTTTATALAAPQGDELSARMRLLGLMERSKLPAGESGVLARMRAICPRRALTWTEAERIAERQAGILRRELGLQAPALPTSALLDLPFLSVTHRDGFPTSGMALKTNRGWVVVIKGDEPTVRQRYSLAHEIKHIVDDELMTELPAGLYRATKRYSAQERAEGVADRFAAALLMPKPSILSDWSERLQDVPVLARRYNVSRLAMEIRLRHLDLLQATPRCASAATHPAGEQG